MSVFPGHRPRRRAFPLLAALLPWAGDAHHVPPYADTALAMTQMGPMPPAALDRRATSACSRENYFSCEIKDGGGCCPLGYLCGSRDCSPPTSILITTSFGCPASYFLCVGGGCCPSGLVCASNACVSGFGLLTTDTTYTTTRDGVPTLTVTRTTVTSTPSSLLSAVSPVKPTFGSVASLTAEAVEKVTTTVYAMASELPPATIGGIVAGVVGFVLLLGAAVFLLLRHLRRMSRFIEARLGPDNAPPSSPAEGKIVVATPPSEPERGPGELDAQAGAGEMQAGGKYPSHELTGSPGEHGVSELDAGSEVVDARSKAVDAGSEAVETGEWRRNVRFRHTST